MRRGTPKSRRGWHRGQVVTSATPAPVWTPETDLDNIAAIWSADSGITITGSGVSDWAPSTGSVSSFAQTVDADRPEIATVNGVDALRTDGVDTWLKHDNEAIVSAFPMSVWVCGIPRTTAAFARWLVFISTTMEIRFSNTSGTVQFRLGGSSVTGSGSNIGNLITACFTIDASANTNCYVNATSIGTSASASTPNSLSDWALGAFNDGSALAAVDTFKIVVTSDELTTDELTALQTYATTTFGGS